jgi:predicted metal-dependent hydrolase
MNIKIIRSNRRRKTIQARQVENTIEILAPAHMSDKELEPHIENLLGRIERRRQTNKLDDGALESRAAIFNKQYFRGRLKWHSIRWVANQNSRYGSCTPARGTIRISHRVAELPKFVRDYVLVHELAHLAEANHGKNFWALVNQYPKTERARGYLMALGMEDLED